MDRQPAGIVPGRITIFMAILNGSAHAAACTLCSTGPSGEGVNGTRTAIFNDQFLSNLLAVGGPFILLGSIVAAIHFAFPEARR